MALIIAPASTFLCSNVFLIIKRAPGADRQANSSPPTISQQNQQRLAQ